MAARRAPRRKPAGVAIDPQLAAELRLLVLDVDGVLTDGSLHYGPRGEVVKVFQVRDGSGIKLLQATGVTIAVISGRKSTAVLRRCRDLGIRHVQQGVADKCAALDTLLRRLHIGTGQTAAIGDDTPDIPLFSRVALSIAVADAHPLARRAARHVTTLPGGRGAVREVCDWLLDARSRA
jgi:3-deoxy-D-manno-octulosonate 8-phosphate phosphatase (KDO 8-P phosphatase)